MHRVSSPVEMDSVLFKTKQDGTADVWLRGNQEHIEEDGETPEAYEADEIYCQVDSTVITEEEIRGSFDFWFENLAESEDGVNADHLGLEAYRAAKLAEISAACQETIFAGTDVELSVGTQHFSLTVTDQINLFGKQAQLSTGAEQLEYHQDGEPCVFYSAADMTTLISAAMEYVSYQTTYCNSLNMWAKSCETVTELAEISYGAEVPEEYQSEVFQSYTEGNA